MTSIERRTAMKKHSMTLVVFMVVMAISTSLLAGEGSRRDARDLSYLNANTGVSASTQVASVLNDRRDARDLSFLTSAGTPEVSGQNIIVQGDNDRRDARDLAYLSGNSKEASVDESNNINLMCCQR
jgi:hypothetical protein